MVKIQTYGVTEVRLSAAKQTIALTDNPTNDLTSRQRVCIAFIAGQQAQSRSKIAGTYNLTVMEGNVASLMAPTTRGGLIDSAPNTPAAGGGWSPSVLATHQLPDQDLR